VIKKTSEAQFAAVAADMLKDEPPEPTLLNADAATQAHDLGYILLFLKYRARHFRVPPVPYRAGLQLMVLDRQIARLRRRLKEEPENVEALVEMEAAMTATADLWWGLVEPVGWFDRLTWRWRENPFLGMEAREFMELRGFFFAARTRCRVLTVSSIRVPHRARSIWRRKWRGLSTSFRSGSGRTGSRAAGVITGSVWVNSPG